MVANKLKRIGIDARFYGPVGKGLGRYTQEVVDNIIKLDKNNEYVIFLSKENFDLLGSESGNIKKVLATPRWYSLAEQLVMPYLVWRERLDLMHWPHFNVPIFCPVKFVVTIHDLILTKFPTARATTLGPLLYKIKNFGYKKVINRAVRRAEKVIAVSEFTKKDIIKHFKINPKKIVVTYEGVKEKFLKKIEKRNDNETLLGYNIVKPFLLYVGNAYPHKNLEGLVKVFLKIHENKPELNLVLVGREDYFYKRLKNFTRELFGAERMPVLFPGFAPDEDLAIFFSNAEAYIFPSFYEGFGLPPLEAMAQGCPVISSNSSSLPEILGDAALYFDPNNEKEMEKIILDLVENKKIKNELVKKGFEQIKKYSWEKCGADTLKIYLSVLNNNK